MDLHTHTHTQVQPKQHNVSLETLERASGNAGTLLKTRHPKKKKGNRRIKGNIKKIIKESELNRACKNMLHRKEVGKLDGVISSGNK